MTTYTQTSSVTHIALNPLTPALASVIWLHGLGADGHDFVTLVPQLNLPAAWPVRFVFPHAPLQPVTLNNGHVMRAWFDIYSRHIEQQVDETGIRNSVDLLEQLIKDEQKLNIPPEKIILAGFSQGAVIALTTGLGYPQKLGGILALSGFLPPAKNLLAAKSLVNQKTPIFLGHGIEDTVVPFMLGQAVAQTLTQQGYPVSWHSYSMQHSVCTAEIIDIAEWLIKCIGQPDRIEI
jgi:phospholipase/carboxylesterase